MAPSANQEQSGGERPFQTTPHATTVHGPSTTLYISDPPPAPRLIIFLGQHSPLSAQLYAHVKYTFIRTVLRLPEAEYYKLIETAIRDKRAVGKNRKSPGGIRKSGIEETLWSATTGGECRMIRKHRVRLGRGVHRL